MISKHEYKAFLVGSPDVELSLIGGGITLDDSQAPHVQAQIDIAWPGHWSEQGPTGAYIPDPADAGTFIPGS